MADNLNKKDYQENFETLVTFGEEGQTLRKDDPRTKEYVDRKKKEWNERSLFEGINLSNKRAEDESYEDYKSRLKLNKSLEKLYKRLGRQQCLELYPAGFKSAIDQVKASQKQELVATMTTEDGKTIPVEIVNKEEKDGSNS